MFENLPKISLESSYTFWSHDGKRIAANADDYLEQFTEVNPYLAADIQNCAQEVADLSGNEFMDKNYIRVFDAVIKTMLGVLALIDRDVASERLRSTLKWEISNDLPF